MQNPVVETIIPNEKLVDRALVESYCLMTGLNTHDLLFQFVNNGFQGFADFLHQQGCNLDLNPESKGILHGSKNLFHKFEPRISKGGPNKNREEPLVYATDDPNYAMFLSILDIQPGGSASAGYRTGQLKCSINTEFVNGASRLVDGYVYVLNQLTFNETSAHHFVSPSVQEPLIIIPTKMSDLTTKIYIEDR